MISLICQNQEYLAAIVSRDSLNNFNILILKIKKIILIYFN